MSCLIIVFVASLIIKPDESSDLSLFFQKNKKKNVFTNSVGQHPVLLTNQSVFFFFFHLDLIHNLVSEVEDNTAEAQRRNDMFPLLMQQTGTRNSWSSKGNRLFPPTYICHIYHFRNIPYIFFLQKPRIRTKPKLQTW